MRAVKKLARHDAGVALLTTLLLLLLMSSLLVGFMLLVNSGQKLGGMNNDNSHAFYASEAGMEKMTADLGTLFDANFAPTGAQLANIQANPPVLSGIAFKKTDGTNGYTLDYPKDGSGNPVASVTQIRSGSFQGMTALATPYTLTVNARTTAGSEVKLTRQTQTVGIPMFQFGIFSDPDLSFHAGPNFNFGGRVHTNGNLFLAEGTGNTLTMSDRVTAVKDVIRTNLANGQLISGGWSGTVNITTSPGTSSFRALKSTEGSLTGTVGSSTNSIWPNISLGATNYAGNIRNGATGAKRLDLGIVTLGSGTTQTIDIIRRPYGGESPTITAERYFAQASLKILLSDNPQDIMQLPCIDTTTQPFDLSSIAMKTTAWTTARALALFTAMTNNNIAGLNTPPVPLAASGAAVGATAYSTANGYWLPTPAGSAVGSGQPIIKGFIKIEAQTAYGTPCGAWRDVTQEILALGYAGRNLNPQTGLTAAQFGNSEPLLALPAAALGASTCQNVHPNAVIRLERVRDNPANYSNASANGRCGVVNNALPASQTQPTLPADYWPNVVFDTREGTFRDATPTGSLGGINYSKMVTLNGAMHYIEVDARNLTRWFAGAIGSTGTQTRDPLTAPNDFTVYISDRRGNYVNTSLGSSWPPPSPTAAETGEYGFSDFINPSSATAGCPNNLLDPGEDVAQISKFFTYGQDSTHPMSAINTGSPWLGGYGPYSSGAPGNLYGTSSGTNALTANPSCGVTSPSTVWPGTYVIHANEARENPNFFFRRAIKITNGSDLSALGTCPGGVACGLSIATENPVYVEGNYNCPGVCAGGVYNDPHVAASILGDAVTLLSTNWNDVNSFTTPFTQANRNATTTYYRTAIVAGKGLAFPWITGTNADTGSDGGVHNFLRYLENWGGQTLYYKGSIVSMYFNRQATGIFKCCVTVYSPPTRGYNFDVEFLQPALLPPRTPLFRDTNTTGFTQLLLPNQ